MRSTRPSATCVVAMLLGLSLPTVGVASQRPAQPPPPPVAPTVVYDWCPDLPSASYWGCYYRDENRIYVGAGGRDTLEHELGHAFDVQVLTEVQRWRFEELIGRDVHAWSSSGETDGSEEYFAEAYKTCRLGMLPHHGYWRSSLYVPRTDAEQRRMCATISRWSRATGLGGRNDEVPRRHA